MRIQHTTNNLRQTSNAFSLVEVIVAMAIVGIVIVVFYTAITHGFSMIRMDYEDRRATQILLQKAETIRLCSWDQLTNTYIPATFTVAYDPQNSNSGVTYNGTITMGDASLQTPYSNDLKQVTVQLNWTTGQLPRQRVLKTFVARYGLQTYID